MSYEQVQICYSVSGARFPVSNFVFPLQWRIVASQDSCFSDQDVREASLYLHDLGSIVWFGEDGLRDVVILDAQWLTQVFSATISAKTNLSTGILKHEDLPWLWRSYPRHLHPFMLTIMEKFELLHR